MEDLVQIVITKTVLCEDGAPVYKVTAMSDVKTIGSGYFVLPDAAVEDVVNLMSRLKIVGKAK